MYYLQSRYYDPELCRFISADDFAYINTNTPMSVNAYAYCINNPLRYKDPKGNAYISGTPQGDDVGKILGALLILWDASLIDESPVLEDFTYYLGGILLSHSDLLFEKGKIWLYILKNNFVQFMNTDLYKTIKATNSNIFKTFFDKSITSGESFLKETYGRITITIGYYDDMFERVIKEFFADCFTALAGKVINSNFKKVTIFSNSFGFYSEKVLSDLNVAVENLTYIESFDDGNMLFSQQYDFSVINGSQKGLEAVFTGLFAVIAYILSFAGTVVKGKVLS